jgi:hypothetical protein
MYIESENTASTHPLEVRRKKYIGLNKKDALNPYNKIKEAFTRIRSLVEKPEGIEDRGRGVTTHVKIFPRELYAGLKKIIPGGKFEPEDELRRHGEKIPGLSIILPGWKVSKLLIQHHENTESPKKGTTMGQVPTKGYTDEPKGGVDAETYRAHEMDVWVNKAAELKDFGDEGKSDWYPLKEFDGRTSAEVTKKVIQFLKTKVKRMAKEEVEEKIDMARAGYGGSRHKKIEKDKYNKKRKGQGLEEVEKRWTGGKLPPHLAKFFDKDGNLKKDAAARVAKGREKINWKDVTPKGYGPKEEVEEGIDIDKASMGAVIKDFQNSDAPQFKGKSDKKRKEMAIAAKLSKEENEDDDPVGKSKKNSKKDKINLKPKMDETMKNYKEFMKKVKEDSDPDTKGTQGDNAEWQKARSSVLKKFGVGSCSALKDEKEKKACYKALDDAHVADHEEQVKKEEVEVSENTKEYKDVVSKILGRRKEVKEAVTTGGIEYGEQDWDVQHRLENSYPNLHANYAEFHEQGLEGPYLWHGETYFFDRKVGGWYSVTEEDFVDDEISKDLSLAYVKDGMYKRQFAS